MKHRRPISIATRAWLVKRLAVHLAREQDIARKAFYQAWMNYHSEELAVAVSARIPRP